jgi:hypothetical protein
MMMKHLENITLFNEYFCRADRKNLNMAKQYVKEKIRERRQAIRADLIAP